MASFDIKPTNGFSKNDVASFKAQSDAVNDDGSGSSSSSSIDVKVHMPPPRTAGGSITAVVRIRPLLEHERAGGRVEGLAAPPVAAALPAVVAAPSVPLGLRGVVNGRPKAWNFVFSHVFGETASNSDVYTTVAQPLLAAALEGRVGALCAHGYSGSGKSHSIVGYRGERGLFARAAADLCAALPAAAAAAEAEASASPGSAATSPVRQPITLSLAVRVTELYLSKAYDLVAQPRAELAVREDADGIVRLRGAVTVGPDGKVSVTQQAVANVSTAEEVDAAIAAALDSRAVGTSTAHHESSRSHCILEVEIVTPAIVAARAAVLAAEAALVPIGQARDAAKIALAEKQFRRDPASGTGVGWTPTGYRASAEEVAAEEAHARAFDAAMEELTAAEARVAAAIAAGPACVGGTLIFVDLAGADYDADAARVQPPAQRREATQINESLLALKACLRGLAARAAAPQGAPQQHIPWRDSRLTHLLRAPLAGAGATCVLLATVAPAAAMLTRTANTLLYAQLGGTGGA